jgi:drug/metabolite transporter (DMT)-like permease
VSEAAKGHLAMLLFSALVAGSFALGSLVANLVEPLALTAARFALSAGFVAGAIALTGGMRRESLRAPWRYLLLGAVFASYFVLMFEGLKTAPPVSTSAVFTLTPLMAAGFGWLLLRQGMTARMALALAVGAAGALWVIFRADLSALLAFEIGRGEAIYFVGCVAHALYTPLARRLNRGERPFEFALGVMISGALVVGALGWRDLVATDWAELPPVLWGTLVYLAFFAAAVTVVLLQIATQRLPSAKVMAYTYLVPSWVVLWQLALGKGVPDPAIFGGVALTGVALALLLKNQSRERNH